jgi:glyoxylase-like metal-dependent hydrolase (beta-lactamase superfamily II)
MIKIKKFVFNPFSENTYVLFDETREAVIIDPGCSTPGEERELKSYVEKYQLKVIAVLNTHGHIDHVLGNQFVAETWNVKLGMCKRDLPTYKSVASYASNYGFQKYREVEPGFFLDEEDEFEFGVSTLSVIFTPGHSVGHIVFVNQEQQFVIGGDVLFSGSIGRTDLPGGNFDTLIESIQDKLFSLHDSFVVYSGHGPETTIGEEKVSNPFCRIEQE